MWIVAGVLLGSMVLAGLIGFHTGPHAHVVAGAIGVAVAAWLIFMAVDGRSAPVLWVLLSADVVVSAGVGITAWNALFRSDTREHHLAALESTEGIAVSDLAPEGIVRVRGEQWSAVSANGTVRAGTKVQVLRAAGVRLEVWGEDAEPNSTGDIFNLDRSDSQEQGT